MDCAFGTLLFSLKLLKLASSFLAFWFCSYSDFTKRTKLEVTIAGIVYIINYVAICKVVGTRRRLAVFGSILRSNFKNFCFDRPYIMSCRHYNPLTLPIRHGKYPCPIIYQYNGPFRMKFVTIFPGIVWIFSADIQKKTVFVFLHVLFTWRTAGI